MFYNIAGFNEDGPILVPLTDEENAALIAAINETAPTH